MLPRMDTQLNDARIGMQGTRGVVVYDSTGIGRWFKRYEVSGAKGQHQRALAQMNFGVDAQPGLG